MGAYIYRVTAERVTLSDGREANVAIYAYKPSWGDAKWNRKMDMRTGCPASRALVAAGRTTGLFVLGDKNRETGKITIEQSSKVYRYRHATFVDEAFNWSGHEEKGVVAVVPADKVYRLFSQPTAQAAVQAIAAATAATTDLIDRPAERAQAIQEQLKPLYTPFDWE